MDRFARRFGREEVFAATLWELGGDQRFTYAAFALYRNCDGSGGAFGDTSVHAGTSDVTRTAVYGSTDAGATAGRVVLVAVNRHDAPLTAAIRLTHTATLRTAEVYELTAATPAPVRRADLALTKVNAFVYGMPARSVTLLVLRP